LVKFVIIYLTKNSY